MRIVALTLALLLAGCTTPEEQEDYELTAEDPPASADGPFSFHLHIDGPEATSDHIGAHYWNRSVEDPTASIADALACDHVQGSVPGEFDVMCDLADGTWYVYGHLRLGTEGAYENYWAEPFTVTVSTA